MLKILGFGLDPLAILVPFLVFRRHLKEKSKKDVQENAEDNKKN
jgi:hypothetical protein